VHCGQIIKHLRITPLRWQSQVQCRFGLNQVFLLEVNQALNIVNAGVLRRPGKQIAHIILGAIMLLQGNKNQRSL